MENQTNITPQKTPTLVAIDVAKETLQVQSAQESFSLENSVGGFKALYKRIAGQANLLVVFEATGGYERPLADFLHARGVGLCILNPRLLRSFARSEGIKAKTDAIDAHMIYRFACSKTLRPTLPPTAQERALADLLDRRCQLTEALAREKNRLHKAASKTVVASLRRCSKTLEKEISLIEAQLRKLVTQTRQLSESASIITSVKGVGEVTAWTLMAQLGELTRLKRNELVALAGIAPFNNDSGKHSGKRHIHGGRSKVRRVLFMAAKSAALSNPVIRSYVQGLIARGKPYKCAITAAMRKLLIHIHSLLKNPQPIPCQ